jgi:hypothetical protein
MGLELLCFEKPRSSRPRTYSMRQVLLGIRFDCFAGSAIVSSRESPFPNKPFADETGAHAIRIQFDGYFVGSASNRSKDIPCASTRLQNLVSGSISPLLIIWAIRGTPATRHTSSMSAATASIRSAILRRRGP